MFSVSNYSMVFHVPRLLSMFFGHIVMRNSCLGLWLRPTPRKTTSASSRHEHRDVELAVHGETPRRTRGVPERARHRPGGEDVGVRRRRRRRNFCGL